MKKNNKTYHLQQPHTTKTTTSPGTITKNTHKNNTKPSPKITPNQTVNQQLHQINKKVQQRLNNNNHKHTKHSERSYHQQYINSYENKDSLSISKSEMTGKQTLNPYQQLYQNDMRYFQQYMSSTAKYQHNGINLNWPYYFTKSSAQYS